MAQQDITITIKTPSGVTTAEAIRLYSTARGYQVQISDGQGGLISNPETRATFCKRTIANDVASLIESTRLQEARQAVILTNAITVE